MTPHDNGQSRPRLQIIHILVWMALSAVVLAIRSAWWEWESSPPWELALYVMAFIAVSMAYGAAIGGLVLFYWRWSRGGLKFPSAPGHWLLMLLAAGALLDGIGTVATRLGRHLLVSMRPSAAQWNLHQVIGATGAAIVCLLFVKYMSYGRRWAGLLLVPVLALVPVALMCGAVLMGYTNWTYHTQRLFLSSQVIWTCVFVVLLILVSWRDAVRHPGRDWLHWVGIGMAGVMTCIHGGEGLLMLLRM